MYIVCVDTAVFRLVADENGVVNEHQLNHLLYQCIQIPRQLGEMAAFGGSNVEPSVRSCFEQVFHSLPCCRVVQIFCYVLFVVFHFFQYWEDTKLSVQKLSRHVWKAIVDVPCNLQRAVI